MKKKQLLAIKPLTVTQRMARLVKEDKGIRKTAERYYCAPESYMVYQRYQYYRAVVEQGILKVAIFMRGEIAAGIDRPQFEIYLDKQEKTWLSYEPEKGKWYTAKADMLNYDCDRGRIYGDKPYAEPADKKVINEYLGTGSAEPKEAVLTFQAGVRKEALARKYKTELEEIDAVMNVVPKLPKDFDGWIIKDGFLDNRYLFYKAGRSPAKEGYCTHCRKTVAVKERPYHNAQGKCPVCHSRITYKAWNKQKIIQDDKNIGILQKLTDESGYILRRFFCRIRYTRETDWQREFAGAWEEIRVKLDNHFTQTEKFEFGEYRHTGVERWCKELNHGWGYDYTFGASVIYTRNLKRVLQDSSLKYVPVNVLLEKNKGKTCHLMPMLRRLKENPQAEYLIKAGMTRFVFEIGEEHMTDKSQKRPWQYLKMTKEQFMMCSRMDAGPDEVRVIQIANEHAVTLDKGQVQWIARYLGRSRLIKSMAYTTPHRMLRYLKEVLNVEEKKERVRDYGDYLEDCRRLDWELGEQLLFPQDFDRAHEECAQLVQEKENREKAAEKELMDMVYRKTINEKRKLYQYESDEFKLVLPKCKDDFQKEGREMHNCVGNYFEQVKSGKCVVLFLRRKEEPEKSFCTVELSGINLIQCRAAYNQDAPEEAKRFMEKFLKELKKRLEKEEKRKLEQKESGKLLVAAG